MRQLSILQGLQSLSVCWNGHHSGWDTFLATEANKLSLLMQFGRTVRYDSSFCYWSFVLSRFSRVQLCATLWTVTHQAPLSMGFFRQEYQSGLPCPSPGDLPDPGIKPGSPALQADSLPSEPLGKSTWLSINGRNSLPIAQGMWPQ